MACCDVCRNEWMVSSILNRERRKPDYVLLTLSSLKFDSLAFFPRNVDMRTTYVPVEVM